MQVGRGSAVQDLQEGLAELDVEGRVDDGVHGAVDVPQPREGAVQDGRDVAVTVYVQDVRDEEGQPADDEHAWGRARRSGWPCGRGEAGRGRPALSGRPSPGALQEESRSQILEMSLTPVCSEGPFTSLSLTFLICQMGIIIPAPTGKDNGLENKSTRFTFGHKSVEMEICSLLSGGTSPSAAGSENLVTAVGDTQFEPKGQKGELDTHLA